MTQIVTSTCSVIVRKLGIKLYGDKCLVVWSGLIKLLHMAVLLCLEWLIGQPFMSDSMVQPCRSDSMVQPCRSDKIVQPCRSDSIIKPCRNDSIVQLCRNGWLVQPSRNASNIVVNSCRNHSVVSSCRKLLCDLLLQCKVFLFYGDYHYTFNSVSPRMIETLRDISKHLSHFINEHFYQSMNLIW